MKSVFLTLIIFAVVSVMLYFNVFDIIGTKGFFYTSMGLLILVFLCAFIFIGLPQLPKKSAEKMSHKKNSAAQKTSTKTKNKTKKHSEKKGTKNENN